MATRIEDFRIGTPPVQLGRTLTREKRYGQDFRIAWNKAYSLIKWPNDRETREQWQRALRSTRKAWRQYYEGRGDATLGVSLAWLFEAMSNEEPGEREDLELVA